MAENLAVIILAAGKGTRMKSALPKVMHKIGGQPMIRLVMEVADRLSPERIISVIGPEMEALLRIAEEKNENGAARSSVVQRERLGTGHAVKTALPALGSFTGDILILYGDTPLITQETLSHMLEELHKHPQNALTILGFLPEDPAEYGRLIANHQHVTRIIEFKDASPEERAISLCNSGVIAIKSQHLESLLQEVGNSNKNGEYYLTDIVGIACAKGLYCSYIIGDEEEVSGINSRMQLAEAEYVFQSRLRQKAMENGVTLIDPDTVYFAGDTRVAPDVVIHPNVVFGPGVSIASGVEIRAFCHIEGAVIAENAVIGPFARIRPHSQIAENAHIGNFVEVKNTVLKKGAKANHLSYIGDSTVGERANIGAGTITCNYDGFTKSETHIGNDAFIGSNSCLVAPVRIENGAIIGAGSVITQNVEENALALARAPQVVIAGKGDDIRNKKQLLKTKS